MIKIKSNGKQSSEMFFASRFVNALSENVKKSFEVHPHKVKNLVDISQGIAVLAQGFWLNYSKLIDEKSEYIKIDEKIRPKILEALPLGDPVRLGLPVISDEFKNFVQEVLSAVYTGAARTLRTVLETAVLTAEFSHDPTRLTAHDIFTGLLSGELSEKVLLMNLPGPALIERFRYRDRFGLYPTFRRLVNSLGKFFTDSLKTEIKTIYSQLSPYAHFSISTYGETIRKLQDKQRISESMIEQLHDKALRVIDITFLLLVQSEANYLGYKDANGRLDNQRLISQIGRYIPGGNIIYMLEAIRERELATNKREFFEYSYPIIKTFIQTMKRAK